MCQNNSNFTGKEKDSESGYYYFGARYLDQDMTTLFLSVDPMVDKYPSISPYAYCAWNPIKLVDPDGREITDFYDIITGAKLKHVDDGIDEAIAINKFLFEALEKLGAPTSLERIIGSSLGKNSDFVDFAGTLYAESDAKYYSLEEMTGIGSVIKNRACKKNESLTKAASQGGIYGWNNRSLILSPNKNVQKTNLAYKAAMLIILTDIDYSNGAYYWQGRDFAKKGSPSYNEFYLSGFYFTSNSHDIFNMGSHRSGKSVDYKYESTAAAGRTVFMRLTNNWKIANKYTGAW